MLGKAPPKVKKAARNCLGVGDVFLITKESESASVAKYKKQAELEKARADAKAQEVVELQKRLAGIPSEFKTVPNNGVVNGKRDVEEEGWILNSLAEDPKPKATDAAKTRSTNVEVLVAVLLVSAALILGYTTGFNQADEVAAWVETNAPHELVNGKTTTALNGAATSFTATSSSVSTLLVTEHGQTTMFAAALVLCTIFLAPIVHTRGGSCVALVLTASAPTAYVWLLPVAAKLGFANSLETLKSHGEFDVVGVISTPQATGWMVALFSLPLVALMRIADVGGRGPQYASRLRSTGVATVALFYLWLLVGCWMRAPVRHQMMLGSNNAALLRIFTGALAAHLRRCATATRLMARPRRRTWNTCATLADPFHLVLTSTSHRPTRPSPSPSGAANPLHSPALRTLAPDETPPAQSSPTHHHPKLPPHTGTLSTPGLATWTSSCSQ